jgi:hypothetical protein
VYTFQFLIVLGIRAQNFWEFSLCRPALFKIFAFLHGTFWDFPLYRRALRGLPLYQPLEGKISVSNASTAVEDQTFGAGEIKNMFSEM